MCGFVGAVGRGADAQVVGAMLRAIKHRGPDFQQVASVPDADTCLGSARLAILDLSEAGNMPMLDHQTGNWIVYNGEVYNFEELRKTLSSLGRVFRSATDTEVVLQAYAQWGRDCVRRFRGMFAFAIWDASVRELWLVRDRLGLKPCYFSQSGSGFLFASEVRALLESDAIDRRIDPDGLRSYLFQGFTVSPNTLVESIQSLMPGCWMRVDASGRELESCRYWQLPGKETPVRPATTEELRERLYESVRMRLVSDVPLGVFLSGGLDSASITAIASRAGAAVKTFTVGFHEHDFDESEAAERIARHFGTRHTRVVISSEEFGRWLPNAMAAQDQPSFDGVNTYCVCKAARDHGLTVAVSGLGSDELFGGYEYFRQIPILRAATGWLRTLEPAVRTLSSGRRWLTGISGVAKSLQLARAGGLNRTIAAYQTAQMLLPDWAIERLAPELRGGEIDFGLPRAFVASVESESPGDGIDLSYLALRLFLAERCLRDTDSMSMGLSLEVRAPYTDHELVQAALSVPAKLRCASPPQKPFLREILRPMVPAELWPRRKRGFTLPIQRWLEGGTVRQAVLDTLSDPSGLRSLGLSRSAAADLVDGFYRSTSTVPWSRLWGLYALVSWCVRHRVSA